MLLNKPSLILSIFLDNQADLAIRKVLAHQWTKFKRSGFRFLVFTLPSSHSSPTVFGPTVLGLMWSRRDLISYRCVQFKVKFQHSSMIAFCPFDEEENSSLLRSLKSGHCLSATCQGTTAWYWCYQVQIESAGTRWNYRGPFSEFPCPHLCGIRLISPTLASGTVVQTRLWGMNYYPHWPPFKARM